MSVAELAETAESTFPGLGLGMTVHAVPSQCSTSVSTAPFEAGWNPTAMTLSDARAMTPFSAELSFVPSFGLGTAFQLEPSQWRIMGRSRAVQVKENPTAHTSFEETAATLFSTLPVLLFLQLGVEPGFGVETVAQLEPFQRKARVRESFRLLSCL